ncbi:hypothetical protein QQX98_003833 [Neonectria punicea]|uniref:Uncharacterized protein n=1 Tax=Neonectria punicea TaxID=979145 RepID=A0ABR1HBV3_9HYPO
MTAQAEPWTQPVSMKPDTVTKEISQSHSQTPANLRFGQQGSRPSSARESRMANKTTGKRNTHRVNKATVDAAATRCTSSQVTSRVLNWLKDPDGPWQPLRLVPTSDDQPADASNDTNQYDRGGDHGYAQQISQEAQASQEAGVSKAAGP